MAAGVAAQHCTLGAPGQSYTTRPRRLNLWRQTAMDDTTANRTTANRIFHHLLANTLVATVTDMTVWFALVFFVYLETRSVAVTAISSGIYVASVALSGIWFGGLVDRYRKKRLMVAAGAFSLCIYAIGLAVYIATPDEAFRDPTSAVLWIFIPLLLAGVLAGNIRHIALPTIITLLFPDDERAKANGLAGTASGIAFLIVSAISGFLVAHSGMYLALLLGIAIMLASLVHLGTIPLPEGSVAESPSTQGSLAEGSLTERATRSVEARSPKTDLGRTLAVVSGVPGLIALIFFTTFNNFLGGVFMGLMDAYGLSLVSVEVWGMLWAVLSGGFIVGGLIIAKWGLGKNPLLALFLANIAIWGISSVFTIQPSIVLLATGMFVYMTVVPYIEAAEHTIIQKVVPAERQGRVFGFAQSVEMAASPLTTFIIGPLTELVFIPFMTTGAGVDLIGGWFGTGEDRGMALVFTVTGIIGLVITLVSMNTKYYRLLSERYRSGEGVANEGDVEPRSRRGHRETRANGSTEGDCRPEEGRQCVPSFG